jgi:dTDP-4-amino-4,6-dideoxygalactose transaminase
LSWLAPGYRRAAWLEPGDRILMSAITDDVILFVALAAGLRPGMAPVSPADGDIDPDQVPDETWSTIGGDLTTNLHGLPDRAVELRSRCGNIGIPLIEDGAHAIETTVSGRPVGTFGDVAAFSCASSRPSLRRRAWAIHSRSSAFRS